MSPPLYVDGHGTTLRPHLQPDDFAGRRIGSLIGRDTVALAGHDFAGTAP